MLKVLFVVAVLVQNTSHAFATLVHVPPHLDPATTNVLVVLHGCLQTPETMALGTGFDQQADEMNFVVVYPGVARGSHPRNCWSWFRPENQKADSGQLRQIMDEVQRIKTSLGLKNPKMFAAGFSAGASAVAGLLACFPSDFLGGVMHSGTAYGIATDEHEADQLMKSGSARHYSLRPEGPCEPRMYPGRMLLIHGLMDRTVAPDNSGMILSQFLPDVRSLKRVRSGANWTRFSTRDFVTDRPRARRIKVHGLGHAWSGTDLTVIPGQDPTGGEVVIPYFDWLGPSATDASWKFIRETLAH